MKKRGRGISTIIHPTGLSGGGDLSTATLKVALDGTVDLFFGTVELGQGAKTVFAQMAAEELGLPFENINVINNDTDTCPWDTVTGANRSTHAMGNAVIMAAREARGALFEVVAMCLGCSPSDLIFEDGEAKVEQNRDLKMSMDVAALMALSMGKIIAGRGEYMKPLSQKDEATGACDAWPTQAFGTAIADVEVDTDTGEVTVLQVVSAYDVGKAINPALCEGQIEGGTVMGIGMALLENLHPYYPEVKFQPHSLADYLIPTAKDTGNIVSVIVEKPSLTGPYGAKGFGEMTMNAPPGAIANAVCDAIGVRICEIPITPELVLRSLAQKNNPCDCRG